MRVQSVWSALGFETSASWGRRSYRSTYSMSSSSSRFSDFGRLPRKAVQVVAYQVSGRVLTLREQEASHGYAAGQMRWEDASSPAKLRRYVPRGA